jgi:lipopolysaccharide export system permease protein
LKKLDKYLITVVLKILLITELAGLIIFVIIEFFEHLEVFTTSFQTFLLGMAYIALRTPYYLNLILPLSFLISMLVLLILMIRSNEIIVLRTSGISTFSLMKSLLAFSLILMLLSFTIAEWVTPSASQASEYIYRVKIKKEEANVFFRNDKIWFKRDSMIGNIDFFDTKQNRIRGLSVIELSGDFMMTRRYDAREGIWQNGSWVFSDVSERTFDKQGITSKKTYQSLRNIITEPPSAFRVVERNPEEMGYRELSKYIRKLRLGGHDIRRYLVDLYSKISFPFINLMMVLAAFSVGLRYSKTKHVSKGVFSGISLGVTYWFVHSIALSLGYSEIFPPLFAAWFSNVLFFSFGIIGIVTLRT